ncbi:hypothetical protein V6N13_128987 [Hibiscus sabdariffa]
MRKQKKTAVGIDCAIKLAVLKVEANDISGYIITGNPIPEATVSPFLPRNNLSWYAPRQALGPDLEYLLFHFAVAQETPQKFICQFL